MTSNTKKQLRTAQRMLQDGIDILRVALIPSVDKDMVSTLLVEAEIRATDASTLLANIVNKMEGGE